MDTNILREDRPEVPADETPHGCIAGVVYVGYMVEDENGEEVEVFDARLCRRCHASETL